MEVRTKDILIMNPFADLFFVVSISINHLSQRFLVIRKEGTALKISMKPTMVLKITKAAPSFQMTKNHWGRLYMEMATTKKRSVKVFTIKMFSVLISTGLFYPVTPT